ncbi:unnamed protein product [Protopolystoma xenopodis]|uniref:Uncharacterized protein n=1 Tax=Protopolystoma xenopodis TaxID=117903 RepID=A0A448XNS7_9PLAT|nr:unnamed protein product [Protopolystoma xenopodis]
MAKLTDDADYDAGETFDKVPSSLSDAGNQDNYNGRRLRTSGVLLSRPDNKTKLRQRRQPTSISRFCLSSQLYPCRLEQIIIRDELSYGKRS